MEKKDLRSLTIEEMTELAEHMGQKAFRGKQLFEWIHKKQVENMEEISNLPKAFLEPLQENYMVSGVTLVKKQMSKAGDTAKYLFSLADGNLVESVWMKYHHGNSVCISSQVGCRMGCTFCASTLTGLTRSLTAGEMLSQIYEIQKETGERVSNVIVMGMGEPLDNYDNLIRFVKLLSHPQGIQISQRSITVSTCGLVDRIRDLMKEKLQITLAISLHAPNDEIRQKTMPIAKKYSIEEIFSVCHEYVDYTGRRVTFEYSMIDGVNDGKAHALELARRCKGLNCHINLIPLNEVKERKCHRSKEENIRDFKLVLEENRINVTIRREMGSDIDAACGQLRNQFMNRPTSE
ncbi:MAG TPA: 23S rRNA (adenine(2503)-C(2))-methyltransferase RlmN [Lachnospiraceae bacterium]|nr:23S rRNA (adenine(2503)-C(2))-methyltransferase RlmN [Lachnospiraceae bacterium]